MRSFLIATFVVSCALSASAEEKSGLAANMKDAKVSLERGIAASKAKGVPISAKYEVENGKLQLSVYTAKGDAFSEVIVDHKTGKVAKSEPITGGDDGRHRHLRHLWRGDGGRGERHPGRDPAGRQRRPGNRD